MNILKLREVKKYYGVTRALDGVDLLVARGEVHALIGENGAGKSTLMNILSGAFRPDSGSMELKGQPFQPANTMDSRRSGITLILQELMLAAHLSVAENILMGIENTRFGWLDHKAMRKRTVDTLVDLYHGDIHPDSKVGDLSIAQQQVVEICRAIAADSEIILMDEPTSSLPREDVTRLFAQIRRLTALGITIIYISHFLEEIREIADSFTVIRDGKSVATGRIEDVTDEFLIAKMVGRPVENLFPHREERNIGNTILEVKALAAPPAFYDVSFELKSGEILGIAGLIGSGRTDLIRAIFRLVDARSGSMSVSGKLVAADAGTTEKRISQGFGYLSEDRKAEGLALDLSVKDNVTMTGFSKCSRFGWLDLKLQDRQAGSIVETMNIRAAGAGQRVGDLSGGNQQKVSIARLVYQEADIFLLDEPTRGVDIGSKAQVYETIAKLAAEGKAIVMVSSYLPELFGMCDRLAVMCRGRLSEARPIAEWTPESVMQAAVSTN